MYSAEAKQEAYFEITYAKEKAEYEMYIAKNEYLQARLEFDRIYDLAKKGESIYHPVEKKSK